MDLDPSFDSRAKTTHPEYQLILFMRLLGLAALGFLQCVVQIAYSGPHCEIKPSRLTCKCVS